MDGINPVIRVKLVELEKAITECSYPEQEMCWKFATQLFNEGWRAYPDYDNLIDVVGPTNDEADYMKRLAEMGYAADINGTFEYFDHRDIQEYLKALSYLEELENPARPEEDEEKED